MKNKLIKFKSPITNLQKEIIIFEPDNIKVDVNVLIFFDGQIFRTKINGFNRYDGINIFKHLKNNKLENSIVILVSSMAKSPNKYLVRNKELAFDQNKSNLFIGKALEIIDLYLKNIKIKNLFGFGFSLSATNIIKYQKYFNHVISISPTAQIKNFKNIKDNLSVYYGNEEYEINSHDLVNKPLNVFTQNNPRVNVIKYIYMKHSFISWDEHFDHIIKSSVVAFLHFQKFNIKGIGKFVHDSSNISFLNKNKHLKIYSNKLTDVKNEMKIIKKTKYKNDYKVIDDMSYIKTFYQGERKSTLNDKDIIHLAQEIKLLHQTPISTEIKKYNYKNSFDQEKFVMSHGDINGKNVLFSKERAFLLDFEWSMLHSYYWDIASVFYKFNLNLQQQEIFISHYQLNNQTIDNNKISKMIKVIKNVEKDFFNRNKKYFITQ